MQTASKRSFRIRNHARNVRGKTSERSEVLLLSNGPGEVSAWVRAVSDALRQQTKARISLILAPCAHASGRELDVAKKMPGIDRASGPESFFPLVLRGRIPDGWQFERRGIVVFLGGEQAFAIALSKRMDYRCLIYAEDRARWTRFGDWYALRSPTLLERVPEPHRNRCTVVGDLLQAAARRDSTLMETTETSGSEAEMDRRIVIGILPGSKRAKLELGIPYMSAVACSLIEMFRTNGFPLPRLLIPLAPTVSWEDLESVACNRHQPWAKVHLQKHEECITDRNMDVGKERLVGTLHANSDGSEAEMEIWQSESPAYGMLSRCDLCITTVGTNTAELAALGTPMVVVLPTHDLAAFRGASGGLTGLLERLPGPVGRQFAKIANAALLRANPHLSWPNRWAKSDIVPELVGRMEPNEVAECAEQLLCDKEWLTKTSSRLRVLSRRAAEGVRTDLNLSDIDKLALLEYETTDPVEMEQDAAERVANMIVQLLDEYEEEDITKGWG